MCFPDLSGALQKDRDLNFANRIRFAVVACAFAQILPESRPLLFVELVESAEIFEPTVIGEDDTAAIRSCVHQRNWEVLHDVDRGAISPIPQHPKLMLQVVRRRSKQTPPLSYLKCRS